MSKYVLLFGLLVGLMFTACSELEDFDEIEGVRYDAQYAIPLVDSKVTLSDLLEEFEENSTLVIDPDGQLRLVYRGDVLTKDREEIFAEVDSALAQAGLIPIQENRVALPFSSPAGIQIDSLHLSGGELIYSFANPHTDPITMTFTFPQLRQDGEAIVFEHSLPAYSGSGDPPFFTNAFGPYSLAEHDISPENDSIFIEYEAFADGEPVDLTNFYILIQGMEFTYAEGYLGNQIHEGTRDTIEIDFFEDWIRGDIYFEDPVVTFFFENSFGIPTRSIVNVFDVITVEQEVLPLESEFVANGIDFPYPGLDQVGEIMRDTFVFNKFNSNIDEILGAGPIAVDYLVDGLTNPESNTDIRGFLTDSSYYKVQVEVDLPLYGRAAGFIARDTIELGFDNYGEVDFAEFKTVTDNGLPLNVDIQGYFLDDNGAVLDSLFAEGRRLVEAAPVDGDGNATGITTQEAFAEFLADRFERIKDAQSIVVNAAFSTNDGGETSVRINTAQEVRIRVGAKLGLSN